MGKLIKFSYVNEHGDFPAMLAHFGLDYARKGEQLRLLCPFHEDTKPSCNITLTATETAQANTFHCFGCHESGSLIDFVSAIHGASDLRAAAELIAKISGCTLAPPRTTKRAEKAKHQKVGKGAKSASEDDQSEDAGEPADDGENAVTGGSAASDTVSAINPVLKFAFRLQEHHEYLATRVSDEVAKAFGLGFLPETSRSMMAGRICIPIHNGDGELIAYAGRYPGEDVPKDVPKYLLPKNFEKQAGLFNLHRLESGCRWTIIVEGFFGAMRLHHLGLPVVACMGTAISEAQVALLAGRGIRHVVLMLDGDTAGIDARDAAASLLTRSFFTKTVTLPDGSEPDTIPEAALFDLLGLPPGWREKR